MIFAESGRTGKDGRIQVRSKKGVDIDLRVFIRFPTQLRGKSWLFAKFWTRVIINLELESLGFEGEVLSEFRQGHHNPLWDDTSTRAQREAEKKTTSLYAAAK